ncbi:Hypothetical predicted protein [Marmota monax]|uniref:Uncharacterized protein n=1 Tax=Marmota monax TaxID=9995 RepID=A0A5E4APE3_MARMO|nr:hypothetical protein GHT09_003597 [Marmota monax]VTJ59174.1 Hypothetical predicted protein [Marmota monax]
MEPQSLAVATEWNLFLGGTVGTYRSGKSLLSFLYLPRSIQPTTAPQGHPQQRGTRRILLRSLASSLRADWPAALLLLGCGSSTHLEYLDLSIVNTAILLSQAELARRRRVPFLHLPRESCPGEGHRLREEVG